MKRKWAALGVTMTAAMLIAGSISVAQDEKTETELHKIMVQVQKHNATIIRGVRNAVFYRRSKEDVAKSAKELVELGKKAKPLTETIKDTEVEGGGDPITRWNETMDAFLKEAHNFAELASKDATTSDQAKDAYRTVSRACTACHEVFRIENADF